eukprot:CAMPEP_0180770756 /NCGR_PEP_ID=MMETSP1038_2-20121128/41804_1 /TAXON_ID=632150 /ORGANISM="Azadinium spinosum, Strain 3D9" /LENGTH=127 /DNA_ID=CAMNT_0022805567 /DNA_START=439 /DNA_END=819 /DNA_ORIENTATION=+
MTSQPKWNQKPLTNHHSIATCSSLDKLARRAKPGNQASPAAIGSTVARTTGEEKTRIAWAPVKSNRGGHISLGVGSMNNIIASTPTAKRAGQCSANAPSIAPTSRRAATAVRRGHRPAGREILGLNL